MPVSWEFRDSVLALRLEGSYANEELAGAIDEAFADPRFGPETRLIVDGRGSRRPITSADVEWRLSFFSSLPGRGLFPRIAFVLRVDQKVLVKLARLVLKEATRTRTVEIDVFTDETSATRWLCA